ncbi:MAG: hypothetical protein M3Z09_17570 [Acidobacteriota bacterium]|nr:hypothetical protein [Acidobacteriota bacterium]
MAITTVLTGVLLIALGAGSFIGTGSAHKTALIPALFGLPILVCGLLAQKAARRALAMHIAVAIGIIGFAGSMFSFIKGVNGEAMQTRPVAVEAQGFMALITALFVGLCIQSFIKARRSRTA